MALYPRWLSSPNYKQISNLGELPLKRCVLQFWNDLTFRKYKVGCSSGMCMYSILRLSHGKYICDITVFVTLSLIIGAASKFL
jgi:hypothetical protein